MLRSYLPAIVFLILGGAVGGLFAVLNTIVGPRRRVEHKQDPYECGLPSEVKRGMRFGISFYLIAMLFILFDIEVVFLYPIAVQLTRLRRLRAGRDGHLHRAAGGGVRVRVAQGSARVEIRREPSSRGRGRAGREIDSRAARQRARLEGAAARR